MNDGVMAAVLLALAGSLLVSVALVAWHAARLRARLRALSHPLHELRGALGVLQLGLELLERGPRAGAQLGRRLSALRQQVARAEAALADIDRRRTGRVDPRRLELQAVDMPALVRRTANAWSSLAPAYGGRVSCEWHAGPALVRGNPVLLQRALDNLIENGLQHGGGRVVVRAERRGSSVRLTLSDGGRGMPRIEVFEEAHWRITRGHGLAIARDALTAVGAEIETVETPDGRAVSIQLDVLEPKAVRPRKTGRRRRDPLPAAAASRAAGRV
jgi:signal transduction histidine kinase